MVQIFKKRHTSPVRYESAPLLAEDLVYLASEDEEDLADPGNERRKTIESLATQYLQGRGLFIQTASLKGPFESGWKNPWAKKRKRDDQKEGRRSEYARVNHSRSKLQSKEDALNSTESRRRSRSGGSKALMAVEDSRIDSEPLSKRAKLEDNQVESKVSVHGAGHKGAGTSWLKRRNMRPGVDEGGKEATPTPTPVTIPAQQCPQVIPGGVEDYSTTHLSAYTPIVVVEKASSKNAARHAARSPKPSPRTVPPNTNQPEFRYHSRKTGSTSTSDKSAFVDSREYVAKRSPSSSPSSSGSSAFAEALEAAQAKASSGGASSHTPSPIAMKPPYAQAAKHPVPKRLSFTASGGIRIDRAIWTTKFGSNDAAAVSNDSGEGVPDQKNGGENVAASSESLVKKDESPSNAASNSVSSNLPSAQILSNKPLLPSGFSTNQFESENLGIAPLKAEPFDDEGDSFVNSSTQAMELKAQRAFQGILDDTPVAERSKVPMKANIPVVDPLTRTIDPELTLKRPLNGAQPDPGYQILAELAPNTQALVDSFSPFAVTTTKKRLPPLKKRTSFAPSSTKSKLNTAVTTPSTTSPTASRNKSFSATAAQPQSSKPLSTSNTFKTSFTVHPNGTFTETPLPVLTSTSSGQETSLQEEGQQQLSSFPKLPQPSASLFPDLEPPSSTENEKDIDSWPADTSHSADNTLPFDELHHDSENKSPGANPPRPYDQDINQDHNSTKSRSSPSPHHSKNSFQPTTPPPVSFPAANVTSPPSNNTASAVGPRHGMSHLLHNFAGARSNDSLDLNTAIEEAGQFLGQWNVDLEVRKTAASATTPTKNEGIGGRATRNPFGSPTSHASDAERVGSASMALAAATATGGLTGSKGEQGRRTSKREESP